MSKHKTALLTEIKEDLDALQMRVDALEAQFNLPSEKARDRVEQARERLQEVLDSLKAGVARQQTLAAEQRKNLAIAIDEFKLQVALGHAEVRDSLEVQREKFEHAVGEFESQNSVQLQRFEKSLVEYYGQVRDRFSAELDAAAIRMREEKAQAGAAFEKRKGDLLGQVERWRHDLEAGHPKRSEKMAQFQHEVKPALQKIAEAFRHLVQ